LSKTLPQLLEAFAGLKILVTGDPIVDVYHFGRVTRVCPEAPVPVFVQNGEPERRNGGAANVRDQLEALGCKTENTFPLYGQWSEKHRYMVGHQLLLRVDDDKHNPADWPMMDVRTYHALVISDYDKGATQGTHLPEWIEAARMAGIPVVVDPKGGDWEKYAGATLVCPNSEELAAHLRYPSPTWPAFAALAIKRGADGIELCVAHQSTQYPAQARHVFDVTGAGDTVTAVMTATLAAGGTLGQACELANIAAGYVVGEVGTTVCPLEHLRSTVDRGGKP